MVFSLIYNDIGHEHRFVDYVMNLLQSIQKHLPELKIKVVD